MRTCKLGLRRLEEEAAWLERYHQLWDARFDELDKVRRETETEGEGRWTQQERVSLPRMKNRTTVDGK